MFESETPPPPYHIIEQYFYSTFFVHNLKLNLHFMSPQTWGGELIVTWIFISHLAVWLCRIDKGKYFGQKPDFFPLLRFEKVQFLPCFCTYFCRFSHSQSSSYQIINIYPILENQISRFIPSRRVMSDEAKPYSLLLSVATFCLQIFFL